MHFNKMKRWGAVALAGTMAFSLIGCGGRSTDGQDNPEQGVERVDDASGGLIKLARFFN